MKIVLCGTYSSFNKGDAAMEISAAACIAAKFEKPVETVILSPFPDRDSPFYSPTAVAWCDRRRLISGSLNLIRGWIWRVVTGGKKSKDKFGLLSTSLRHTAESDVVVDLSGDMLTEDYGVHVAYSHYIPLLRAVALGRPYMICAQSIGPFNYTLWLARYLLNRAIAITVRDAISRDYLLEIGIRPELVSLTADLAFMLQPADSPAVQAEIAAIRSGEDKAGTIGVSVSRLVGDKYDRRVGQKGALVGAMSAAIGRLARAEDLRVLIVPHVFGPSASKDDRIISRNLRDALPADLKSHVVEADLRPEELKGIISTCDLFVGTRMHANIAALSSGIPVIAIAYSHKTPGIMRACGIEEFTLNEGTLDEDVLYCTLQSAFERRAEIRGVLEKTIPELRDLAGRNIDILKERVQDGMNR